MVPEESFITANQSSVHVNKRLDCSFWSNTPEIRGVYVYAYQQYSPYDDTSRNKKNTINYQYNTVSGSDAQGTHDDVILSFS